MLLKEAVLIKPVLESLCKKRLNNFKISRALSKLLIKVSEETEFYSKEYSKLLDEYAKKDENGKFVLAGKSKIELKNAAAKELFEKESNTMSETDIGTFDLITIKEKDFIDPNDFPTAQEMVVLECVINWDE